jgi:magnesium chelatase subunit I
VLENTVSNAERRALVTGEPVAVARVTDIYAALPSITGKFELEYEGELKGAEQVAHEIVRAAVATVFDGYVRDADLRPIVEWFDTGGTLQLDDLAPAAELVTRAAAVAGLAEAARRAWPQADTAVGMMASAIDFVLEGLYALKRISRTESGVYQAADTPRPRVRPVPDDALLDDRPAPAAKKKYYN